MSTNVAEIVLVSLNLAYIIPALVLGGAATATVLRQLKSIARHA